MLHVNGTGEGPGLEIAAREATARDGITIALLRAGDAGGLERLLGDHGATVRGRLCHQFGRLLDDSEIDDAMELATIRVWRSATRFDETLGTLRAWFAVIARNCALRMLAEPHRSLLVFLGDADVAVEARSDAEPTRPDRQRLLRDLAKCLSRLPLLQRAVLCADLEAGAVVPAHELASRFATSPNSIYVSRRKGRRALRAALVWRGHLAGRDDGHGLADGPARGGSA